MGLLRGLMRAGGALRREARQLATPVAIGSTLGGTSAAASGGDWGDIGRGMMYGAGAGVGLRGIAALPGALKLSVFPALATPSIAGALAVHGDVDAAARKLLMIAQGDPQRLEGAADILYGERSPYESEIGPSGQNSYGISASDEIGTALSGTERDAAVQRAYEMLQTERRR